MYFHVLGSGEFRIYLIIYFKETYCQDKLVYEKFKPHNIGCVFQQMNNKST